MPYVRGGMGAVGCDAGFAPTADGTGCESIATYSLGQPCVASSFPWVGTIDANVNCAPLSGVPLYVGLGIAGLALVSILKGRR